MDPAAGARILPLRVLANADEIDPAVLEIAQRGAHTGEQPDRPEVDEELELLPDPQLDAPRAHVVRNAWRADRAEVDRVVPAQDLGGVFGHHPARVPVVV